MRSSSPAWRPVCRTLTTCSRELRSPSPKRVGCEEPASLGAGSSLSGEGSPTYVRSGVWQGGGKELCGCFLADLLGQSDEDPLWAADVAEPIHVFVLDHFVDELRSVPAEPVE